MPASLSTTLIRLLDLRHDGVDHLLVVVAVGRRGEAVAAGVALQEGVVRDVLRRVLVGAVVADVRDLARAAWSAAVNARGRARRAASGRCTGRAAP